MRIRNSLRLAALVALAAPVLAGCLDSTGPEPVLDIPIEEVDFAPALGINLGDFTRQESGIWIREDAPGEGDAILGGQQAGIHYSGWVWNGDQFDRAQEEDGPPQEFILGAPGPIAGLSQGVLGMRRGGQRTVLVPPILGFGGVNLPGIPANSWLVLELRLMTIDGSEG
jgi:FKBP-type peptidyl-prolyl cis-trans isomerase FkpA